MKVGLFLLALLGLVGGGYMGFQGARTLAYIIFSGRTYLATTSMSSIIGLMLRTGFLLALSIFVVIPVSFRMLQEALSD